MVFINDKTYRVTPKGESFEELLDNPILRIWDHEKKETIDYFKKKIVIPREEFSVSYEQRALSDIEVVTTSMRAQELTMLNPYELLLLHKQHPYLFNYKNGVAGEEPYLIYEKGADILEQVKYFFIASKSETREQLGQNCLVRNDIPKIDLIIPFKVRN